MQCFYHIGLDDSYIHYISWYVYMSILGILKNPSCTKAWRKMYYKEKNLQKQGLVCLMKEQISVWYIFKVKTNHENMQESTRL